MSDEAPVPESLDAALAKWLDDDRMVRSMCETVAENSPGAAAAMSLVLKTYNAKVVAIEMLRVQVGRTEMALERSQARCMDLEGGKDALRATIARVRAIAESSAGIVAEAIRVAIRPPDELPEHWKAFYRRTGTPLPKDPGDDVTDDRLRGKERLVINGVPYVVEPAPRPKLPDPYTPPECWTADERRAVEAATLHVVPASGKLPP